MNRQLLIENYFKSKASPSTSSPKTEVKLDMNNKVFKKRNLSLNKPTTPKKCRKVSDENKAVSEVINLCSDDEDFGVNSPRTRAPCVDLTQRSNDSEDAFSDCSGSTVTYSPGKSFLSPSTPSRKLTGLTTPKKEPLEPGLSNNITESQETIERVVKRELCETPQENVPRLQTPKKSPQSGSSLWSTQASSQRPLEPGPSNNVSESQTTERVIKHELCNETTQENVPSFQTPKKSPQSGSSLWSTQDFSQRPLEPGPSNNVTESQTTDRVIKHELCNETTQESVPSFQTPKKSPKSSSLQWGSLTFSQKSPSSREKFFSPLRKRNVVKRTPHKAVRSLTTELKSSLPSRILFEDDLFTNSCEGMDDKTKFLLEMINKFLNTLSLQHLLDSESQALLRKCFEVVKPGMKLVCRLYWRKEGWYMKEQVIKICSEENEHNDIHSFQEMMTSLLESGLVAQSECSTHNMSFDDLTSILKKDDLKEICKELKMNINSKQDAIEALRTFSKSSSNITKYITGCSSSNSMRVLKMMSAKAGVCYKLSDLARTTLYKLYIIMYLGMNYNIIREKKLELTLIYDKIQRETYPIDKEMVLDNASVVFKTRDQFERYLAAHHIFEDFISITDLNAKCTIVKEAYRLYQDISEDEMDCYISLPQWLQRFTPASLYVKILELGVQDLKKVKQEDHYELALDILDSLISQNTFRQHRKAEWYAEKALILHSCLSRYDEAAEVLLAGFRSDLSEEAKDSMRPRAKKIANQKNITLSEQLKIDLLEHATKETILEKNFSSKHIDKQPMERSAKRGKVKFETRTADGRLVQEAEEYCITHYICSGEYTHGEHWEGRIVTSLFSLLFWDIIYSRPGAGGVRGIFLSRFQLYPLDLFTDSFYTNRQQAVDEWLHVIETAGEEKLLNIIEDAWNNRPDYELSGFSRGAVTLEQLKAVAGCLRARGVAATCRRLARHYRHAHCGFPDLTLWHAHSKQIKFVEVKTDTDKPSMKQLQWMQYLQSHDIAVEFCYVGVHTTRQRCRTHAPTRGGRRGRARVKQEPEGNTDREQ